MMLWPAVCMWVLAWGVQVARGVMYTREEAEGKRLRHPFDTITGGCWQYCGWVAGWPAGCLRLTCWLLAPSPCAAWHASWAVLLAHGALMCHPACLSAYCCRGHWHQPADPQL